MSWNTLSLFKSFYFFHKVLLSISMKETIPLEFETLCFNLLFFSNLLLSNPKYVMMGKMGSYLIIFGVFHETYVDFFVRAFHIIVVPGDISFLFFLLRFLFLFVILLFFMILGVFWSYMSFLPTLKAYVSEGWFSFAFALSFLLSFTLMNLLKFFIISIISSSTESKYFSYSTLRARLFFFLSPYSSLASLFSYISCFCNLPNIVTMPMVDSP